MSKNELVKCKRKDCFANINRYVNAEEGVCKILNGSFKYECPFFKIKKQFEDGIKKYGGLH